MKKYSPLDVILITVPNALLFVGLVFIVSPLLGLHWYVT